MTNKVLIPMRKLNDEFWISTSHRDEPHLLKVSDLNEAYVVKERNVGDKIIIAFNGELGDIFDKKSRRSYYVHRFGPSLTLKEKDMLTRIAKEDLEYLKEFGHFWLEYDEDLQKASEFEGKCIIYLYDNDDNDDDA